MLQAQQLGVLCRNIPERSVDYVDKGSADLPRRLARPASGSDLASASSLAQPASQQSSSAKQQLNETLNMAFAYAWLYKFTTMLCMACYLTCRRYIKHLNSALQSLNELSQTPCTDLAYLYLHRPGIRSHLMSNSMQLPYLKLGRACSRREPMQVAQGHE